MNTLDTNPTAIAVLGLQWGDEGKGKIIDHLAANAHAVVRFQGGDNAGHTLWHDGQKYVFRLVPSGMLHDDVYCVLGNGVALSLQTLSDELSQLAALPNSRANERLKISADCPLVLPQHMALDAAREQSNQWTVGTTKRGIGPAYEDNIARRAIRLRDVYQRDFRAKLTAHLVYYNQQLQWLQAPTVSLDSVYDHVLSIAESIEPMLIDVPDYLATLSQQGRRIIFEGAQGTALDVHHGSYPYVTSSNTTIGGIATGAGFPPQQLSMTIGVCKAYTTRVGMGPFPTECHDRTASELAERGHEFGSVTGRPRRCGWLDIVALKRAIQLNGVNAIIVTKIDVLDAFDTIQVATSNTSDAALSSPIDDASEPRKYTTLPGWQANTAGVSDWQQLPTAAQQYVLQIEQWLAVPVIAVSTGPDRRDMIWRQPLIKQQER